MPQISVIVPVYKVEPFLHRCVDSILNQSFADFELILVDDGSPDNCGAICEEYAAKDPRVRVIHQKNGGLSAARNTGIDWVFANSDSQWLTFVDSDDWIQGNFLEALYTGARETGCYLATCDYYMTQGERRPDPEHPKAERVLADDYYCGERGSSSAIACAKLYARDLFRAIRYPVGKLHEDEFTTYRIVYQNKWVCVVHGALYAYYVNPEGIMLSQWNPRRLHILEAFEGQIAYARETGNERLYRKAVRHYIYSIHEQLKASQKVFHKELRVKYRAALKLGRETGVFPKVWDNLWAYEEAYPVKLYWWLLFRLGRKGGKG